MNWLKAIKEMKLPPLVSGSHSGPEVGLCAMEMVAFMECLSHTDKPECTCPVIREFVIATNDMLDDEQRQKLLPVLPELVDTVVDLKMMQERKRMICNRAMQSYEHQSRRWEEAQYLVRGSVMDAVRLLFKLYPPFHVADILIGVLREAIEIGRPETKTEFKKPERVKELVKVTYLPNVQNGPQEVTAMFDVGLPPKAKMMHYTMPFSVIDPKKAFMAIDCAV